MRLVAVFPTAILRRRPYIPPNGNPSPAWILFFSDFSKIQLLITTYDDGDGTHPREIDVPFALIRFASAFDVDAGELMARAFADYARLVLLAIGRRFSWEPFGREQSMMNFIRDLNDGDVPDLTQEPTLLVKLEAAFETHNAER
ncbi:hypothetical protein FHP25_32615 [Vineibacter terrae]|uniref:Uncharacterized protein n=1 Tax=Vineibacter terrae TaxID=2586908 RepID=A0A5C8PCQ0_9HYPH|nr:hypothetical protein [Vineibacter terrae]TXL70864.1 hypothetical protein FHP25_32615 [Vineibacter terrae]